MTQNQMDHVNDCKNQENHQIRGKRRIEVAKACLLTGGSAKATSLAMKSDEEVIEKPSAAVVQKCKDEFKKKDLISNDWMINLQHQAEGLHQGN